MGKRQFDQDEYHWYALDVVRQKEYVAGYLLNKMGAMTFIPTATRFRKKNRYTKGSGIEVAHAALPGTVFAGFPDEAGLYRALRMNLVNGVLSVDEKPRRIHTAGKEWINYRYRELDGQMTLERHLVLHRGQEVERSVAQIFVQGRGVLRTHTAMKQQVGKNRPLVIRAAGERARIIGAMLAGEKVAETAGSVSV